MKKLLFIPLIFLSLLVGCKGGPGNSPAVPEQFDIEKINFNYEMYEGYEEYKGLELYKKISNDKEHYLFYIENSIKYYEIIKVFYDDEILGTIDLDKDFFSIKEDEFIEKYFNLELNVEEPETFKEYTYEFEKLGNNIHLIILPTVKILQEGFGYFNNYGYEKFIESDDYSLYYSDDEKDIHIGFTFKDSLLKPNYADNVYNFTDLTKKNNGKYCIPVPFCINEKLDLSNFTNSLSSTESKEFFKNLIGFEYKYMSDLEDDCKSFEWNREENTNIYNYKNSSFNEETYNFIKNHGTTFNISFDKLSFKGIYNESWEEYINLGFTVKINSVELYELNNEKYVSTLLTEKEYPSLYTKLKANEINIILNNLEVSPYENKILGYNYLKYRY